MEVAIGGNGSSPFQREVREWQRVDPNTGALLTGRLEADRWINGPLNAYGKVVDSQNVSQPNGTQHSQRKQFEVLQARTSSGSLQVVRAQTVQTSSSRWSSSGTRAGQSSGAPRFTMPLQITNGHYGMTNGHEDHVNHQSHQFVTEPSLKLSTLMKSSTASSSGTRSSPLSSPIGSMSQRHHHDATPSISTDGRYRPTIAAEDRVGGSGGSLETHNSQLFEGARIERETSDSELLQHLHRGRSISNDDLASTDWDQNDNDGSESSEWRRVSKIRRSFQFPKSTSPKLNQSRPPDLPENSVSVSRIRQELENGRRLSTAMRNNHVDLAALDNILNGSPETAESKSSKKSTFLTAESLKEIRGKLKKLSDESLYKEDFITQNDIEKTKSYDDCPQEGFIVHKPVILQDPQTIHQPSFQFRPKPEVVHTTNSLENRVRHRDTTSAEWHLRRKSYGFEKMAPPSDSMFRQETSTDSGIGRSGELNNWSPTENSSRGTVVTFGDSTSKSRVALMNSQLARRFKDSYDSANDLVEVKRHSIAVDESKYVRDNLRKVFDTKTSIHLNGFYSKEINSSQSSVFDDNGKRHRRVEFCKTEVHFAAESGRVNIVETDGKPPPTNNFRRRRRSSGAITSAYMEAINSGRSVTHFGDDRKSQLELDASSDEIRPHTVTVITNGGPDVILPCTVQEEEEEEEAEEISIRGILKNKPVKPKPYHLGDNVESKESLWGVRLRPVSGEFCLSKPEEATVSETRDTASANNSVAERVRIVEERKDGAGYSTKINLNLSNSPYSWEAPDLSLQPDLNEPIKLRLEDRRKSTQFETLNDSLKSTSLIMKTMRSQSHYEESSTQLKSSDAGSSSHLCRNVSSRLISNMNSISKSSSTNSIFYDNPKPNRQQYSSSLDGDIILNDDESSSQSSKVVSSSSFSSTSSSSFQFERAGTSENQVRHMEALNEEPASYLEPSRKPVAAPRIKIIGSSNAVSHQLSQLRRMYDAAEMDSDDSARADEEVKLYLGNGSTTSVEEKTAELSGSWSRIKAKRASIKQTKNDLKELPKSNVLSIELHSPTVTLQRTSKEAIVLSKQDVPVAKPRTISSVKTNQTTRNDKKEAALHHQTESTRKNQTQMEVCEQKVPLKIENGGTRKLKVHELLYFGVKLSNDAEQISKTHHSIAETNRKNATNSENNTQKWKLSSDKPDLLRHSPTVSKVSHSKESSVTTKKIEEENDNQSNKKGPIYENIKKPSSYNRTKDDQRNQMILNEMNQEADQALKAISSDKSKKDHNCRSSQRSSRPLDTIDEKRSSKLRQQSAKIVAVRQLGEAYHRQCCSNRSSSVSSTESLSRLSGSNRSKDSTIYINVRSSKKHTPLIKDSTEKTHRSSSRDTQRTNASSSEDLQNNQNNEVVRRSRKARPKEKEKIVLKVDEHQRITRSAVRSDDRTKAANKPSSDSTKASLRSSKGDKYEKTGTTRSKVSSIRSSSDSRKMSQSKPSPGIVSSTSSSSKRNSRDHTRK